jgi:pimeloyl-ACP methyl ester carboxylesterase
MMEKNLKFPLEFQFTTIEGHRMAYHRAGNGEVVLLVHGITTYSFIWRNVMPFLVNKYDVIAVDLLGCGDSDKPLDRSYSLTAHAGYLREFINTIGISKVHFVGHDLGGGIGQILAVRQPDMLHDLTVINTVAHDFWPVQPIIAMRTPIIRQLMMGAVDVGAFKLIVKRGLHHKDRLTPELMELFMRPMRTPDGRKAFLHFARCLDNKNLTDIEAALGKLAMPVLIIRGDADVYLTPAIAERLHKEIPGSELVRIATGGHFIQEDEPEQIAQLIADFIERRHAG